MKYKVKFTGQFKKDLKLLKKQGKDVDKLFEVIEILANGKKLKEKYREHNLTGNYKGTRECHIDPDWLLIYEFSCYCVQVPIPNFFKFKNKKSFRGNNPLKK